MVGLDLFAGAGGMSLGASWAGIKVKAAIEKDLNATNTFKHNHPGIHVYQQDIQRVKTVELGLRNEELIIFGGAPCKGFSTSNQRNRSRSNPNNWLFQEFLRLVTKLKPSWVVFENVKGILETEDGLFINEITAGLERSGYTVSCNLLDAQEFGVPQRRSRVFIIGSLHGIAVEIKSPINKSSTTVGEAIGDLPILSVGGSTKPLQYNDVTPSPFAKKMRGDLQECSNHLVTRNNSLILRRYEYVPQGGNWENIPARLMKNYKDRTRCHTGIYYRLRPDEPSKVIGNFRKNMVIHPDQNRGLSVREAARLQSFPDWFEFKGSIGFQQEQVGNAVPPLLAKAVFETVMKCHNQS